MIEYWYLEFILIGFWVLVGIMAYMLWQNSQERKRRKQHDAEEALARELEQMRQRHTGSESPEDKQTDGEDAR